MTLNILVSFSLLALVVTARPLKDTPQSVRRSLQVQNAVQAILASRTGESPDCLNCEDETDVHVSLTTSEEQSALLSSLDDLDAIKAVIPLNIDENASEDEKQLYEILNTLKSTGSLDDIDGYLGPTPKDATSVTTTDNVSEGDTKLPDDISEDLTAVTYADTYFSPPLIVLVASCIAALLAVLCVGAGLYAYNHINNIMVKSGLAWDVLPHLEKQVCLDVPGEGDVTGGSHPENRRLLYDAPLPPIDFVEDKMSAETNERVVPVDVDEPFSDGEELEEKFHDAPEHSLLLLDSDLPQYQSRPDVPRIVVEEHADPDFLPLPDVHSDKSTPFSTPLRTPTPLASPTRSPARRAPQMREVQSSPTLSSKPLWSLRAADAPILGLSGTSSSSSPSYSHAEIPTPMLPGALFADDAPEVQVQRPRTRTPRQPLDIAFALQLRPGLGLGADSAWIVRFMMAMFGWMTFFIGGPRKDTRRTLTA